MAFAHSLQESFGESFSPQLTHQESFEGFEVECWPVLPNPEYFALSFYTNLLEILSWITGTYEKIFNPIKDF